MAIKQLNIFMRACLLKHFLQHGIDYAEGATPGNSSTLMDPAVTDILKWSRDFFHHGHVK